MRRVPGSARRGNSAVELAMFIPILALFLAGMIQLGKITILYYSLKKTLYSAAMSLASQQGVDFCADSTGVIASTINLAVTGTPDGSGTSTIPNLTADMLSVQTECIDPNTQTIGQCTANTCDPVAGGPAPDFVVVSLTGYEVQPRIPFLNLDPIPLIPSIRVPFGGT